MDAVIKLLAFASGLMFLAFVFWALGNWWRLIYLLTGKRKRIGLPIIPGLLGAVALLIAPSTNDIARWHSYWWIPLFADVGCVPWLIYYVWFSVKNRHRHEMRLFRHIIAEYVCTRRCGYEFSAVCVSLSPFHIIAAAVATIPLWIVSLCSPLNLSWYFLFGIFAGELLLAFLAGFLSSILMFPFTAVGETYCKNCRSRMVLVGRHFDPLGSKKPHWKDIFIFGVFIILNVALWIDLTRGKLWQ